MGKIIRCSKLYYMNDASIDSIVIGVICSVGIISTLKNSYYTNNLIYISCIFVIALILWSYLIRGKKSKIEIEENRLLSDYNENEEDADKKYNGKYIKLIGTVLNIEFDEYKDIFISLKSDDDHCIEASVLFQNKKCIKYIGNIHEGDTIIVYGSFMREKNRLLLDVKYLSFSCI